MDMKPDFSEDPDGLRGARAAQAAILAEADGDADETRRTLAEIVREGNRGVVSGFLYYSFGFLGGFIRDVVEDRGREALDDLLLTFLDPETDLE